MWMKMCFLSEARGCNARAGILFFDSWWDKAMVQMLRYSRISTKLVKLCFKIKIDIDRSNSIYIH